MRRLRPRQLGTAVVRRRDSRRGDVRAPTHKLGGHQPSRSPGRRAEHRTRPKRDEEVDQFNRPTYEGRRCQYRPAAYGFCRHPPTLKGRFRGGEDRSAATSLLDCVVYRRRLGDSTRTITGLSARCIHSACGAEPIGFAHTGLAIAHPSTRNCTTSWTAVSRWRACAAKAMGHSLRAVLQKSRSAGGCRTIDRISGTADVLADSHGVADLDLA